MKTNAERHVRTQQRRVLLCLGAAAPPQRLARGRRGGQGGDRGAPDQPRCGGEWECHGGGRWQG